MHFTFLNRDGEIKNKEVSIKKDAKVLIVCMYQLIYQYLFICSTPKANIHLKLFLNINCSYIFVFVLEVNRLVIGVKQQFIETRK